MKLWVDDIRNAPDDTWTVARTVTSAIKFIAMFPDDITQISLDHDISYQIELNGVSRPYPSPETFQAVAEFIGHAVHPDMGIKVSIHSANPVGAKAIKEILESYDFKNISVVPMGAANRLESEV